MALKIANKISFLFCFGNVISFYYSYLQFMFYGNPSHKEYKHCKLTDHIILFPNNSKTRISSKIKEKIFSMIIPEQLYP